MQLWFNFKKYWFVNRFILKLGELRIDSSLCKLYPLLSNLLVFLKSALENSWILSYSHATLNLKTGKTRLFIHSIEQITPTKNNMNIAQARSQISKICQVEFGEYRWVDDISTRSISKNYHLLWTEKFLYLLSFRRESCFTSNNE